uniref:Uncharacterized protein n=1 Tax=Utricularia reniformis TaxID=192314 RepID=A0A1Y0AZY9_9LAMI|nr:hypothetical protein AEK19_MT0488 [Utricularia reniformis]ART30745.1 hypothetical protein AEK19_MT0488 [Utricularia reniformis]
MDAIQFSSAWEEGEVKTAGYRESNWKRTKVAVIDPSTCNIVKVLRVLILRLTQ